MPHAILLCGTEEAHGATPHAVPGSIWCYGTCYGACGTDIGYGDKGGDNERAAGGAVPRYWQVSTHTTVSGTDVAYAVIASPLCCSACPVLTWPTLLDASARATRCAVLTYAMPYRLIKQIVLNLVQTPPVTVVFFLYARGTDTCIGPRARYGMSGTDLADIFVPGSGLHLRGRVRLCALRPQHPWSAPYLLTSPLRQVRYSHAVLTSLSGMGLRHASGTELGYLCTRFRGAFGWHRQHGPRRSVSRFQVRSRPTRPIVLTWCVLCTCYAMSGTDVNPTRLLCHVRY
eukprot:1350479-Rhodomonas_salina.2